MLGLKSVVFQTDKSPPLLISQLPQEILELIIKHLYYNGDRQLDSILPPSRSCRMLRQASLPFMFEFISGVIREFPEDTRNPLRTDIFKSPHLLKHVKGLYLQLALKADGITDARYDEKGFRDRAEEDLNLLRQCIKDMTGLRFIRLHCSLLSAISILEMLSDRPNVEIIFDHITSFNAGKNEFRLFTKLVDKCRARSISFGYFKFDFIIPSDQKHFQSRTIRQMKALMLHATEDEHLIQAYVDGWDFRLPAADDNLLIEELRLTIHAARPVMLPSNEPSYLLHQKIPWRALRRLCLSWDDISDDFTQFLDFILPDFIRLEQLHLQTSDTRQLHTDCPYYMWDQIRLSIDSTFRIEFANLPSLWQLHIEGICNHVRITNIVSPQLRSFKLHRPRYESSVASPISQRSPTDLLNIAKIASNLEHLELDIGYIENLWHPTAIPGVDVDVEQYQFLSSFSHFKKLKFLRLFPPYTTREMLNHPRVQNRQLQQPVSDEQAIRLFHHIRDQCPTLQTLSISASRIFGESTHNNFQAMNWTIRAFGNSAILTTRQGEKNYEQRQVWIGQRRITTEIKRLSYHKPYLSPSDSWYLSPDPLWE